MGGNRPASQCCVAWGTGLHEVTTSTRTIYCPRHEKATGPLSDDCQIEGCSLPSSRSSRAVDDESTQDQCRVFVQKFAENSSACLGRFLCGFFWPRTDRWPAAFTELPLQDSRMETLKPLRALRRSSVARIDGGRKKTGPEQGSSGDCCSGEQEGKGGI